MVVKVYKKLDISNDENVPLINILVNYIYFTAYTEKLHFSPSEEEMIMTLSVV